MFEEQFVRLPFAKKRLPVTVQIRRHRGIASIGSWRPELKQELQEACFRSYQDKVKSIGREGVPRIRRAAEVWRHIDIQQIVIDPTVDNRLLVYVVPDWDESEHMEWCIQDGEVVYVGQFLGYPLESYCKDMPGNHASA